MFGRDAVSPSCSQPRRRGRGPALLLTATAAIAVALVPGCSGPSGPISGRAAYAHVQKFVEIGPRPFGSDALAKTTDYIEGELKAMGLAPQRHELMHEQEKKLIRNLYVAIDGPDPEKGPILMIGAHYDTKVAIGHSDAEHNFPFVGAIDGGGAPAVLIELARHLKDPKNRPDVNVWLYWIDAEESIDWQWNDDRALLGSKAFCQMLHEKKIKPRVKAFVLLDLIGSKSFKIDKDGNSVPALQSIIEGAAKELGHGVGPGELLYEFPKKDEVAEYARRGMKWGTKDDHEIFQNYGIPSVLLIDFARRIPGEGQPVDERFERWWHTPDDNLDAVDPDALAITGNLVVAALPGLAEFCKGKRRKRSK